MDIGWLCGCYSTPNAKERKGKERKGIVDTIVSMQHAKACYANMCMFAKTAFLFLTEYEVLNAL